MKILVVISTTFLLTLIPVDVQRMINVSRIRHFEIISESGDLKTINITLFHDKMQDRVAGVVEFTRNVHLKQVTFLIFRCSFENYACENFQTWKVEGKVLEQMPKMKNQMWSPLFDNFNPKLDVPHIKKSIYRHSGGNFDANAVLKFYPEATKYFWKLNVTLVDIDDKTVATLLFEATFHTFAVRDRKEVEHTRNAHIL
ncbi:uncharacterized protein LOC135834365 [Planococcus citri]|uniref:uncharacterized protein LOC135834365 n=1 Tax=Planococcus citri TaxID=170843 RepID=UPI0031F752B0